MSRYRFVSTMKAEGFPIDAACEAAEVSTSAYYEWLQRAAGPTEAELDEAYLINRIRDIHADSDSTYGSPRVNAALRRRGYCVNHKRTERLMAENAIVGVTPRRRTPRTTMAAEGAPPLPDLSNQDFVPGEPDRRWAGDITYIGTDEGWLYLASVLDLGSRRLVGWAMDETMPTGLVADALRQAADLRGGDITGVIFHSDRGSQGGFQWSSQHLSDGGVPEWESRSSSGRRGQCGRRCSRRDGRRSGNGIRFSSSGSGSPRDCRVRTQRPRSGCHPPLGVGGSVRLAGCDLSALPHYLAVTCPSPNVRRSPSSRRKAAV